MKFDRLFATTTCKMWRRAFYYHLYIYGILCHIYIEPAMQQRLISSQINQRRRFIVFTEMIDTIRRQNNSTASLISIIYISRLCLSGAITYFEILDITYSKKWECYLKQSIFPYRCTISILGIIKAASRRSIADEHFDIISLYIFNADFTYSRTTRAKMISTKAEWFSPSLRQAAFSMPRFIAR